MKGVSLSTQSGTFMSIMRSLLSAIDYVYADSRLARLSAAPHLIIEAARFDPNDDFVFFLNSREDYRKVAKKLYFKTQ